jgi:hypothetical protein
MIKVANGKYIKGKCTMSLGSSVGTATAYGLDDRGVRVRLRVGSRMFTSPYRPGRLWGPPSLLSDEHRELFRRE